MSGFHDVEFPLSLAFGASGGPQRLTQITQMINGAEQRNAPHAHSRRRYNAGAGIKSLDDIHTLIEFFEARLGQLYSFRFKDPTDHKSCKPSADVQAHDQRIGTGDGVTTRFYLQKTYQDAHGSYTRRITKPRAGTVRVGVNDVETVVEVESLTGAVLFPTPPAMGSRISAGFEFDVVVRFDTEALDLTLEAFGAAEAANLPLIEVHDHESA